MDNQLNEIEKYYPFILLKAISECFDYKASRRIGDLTWHQFQFMILVNHYTRYMIDTSQGKMNEIKSYPTLKIIAEEMMMTHQNAKVLVNALKRKGFVDIIADPDDKKKQRIRINEFGQTFINEHAEINSLIESSLDGLEAEDIRRMVEVLTQISSNLASAGNGYIKVRTINHEEPRDFDTFRKCKIVPRIKNRPYYQLYGSKGAVLQVSGINRFILAFYETEEAIDREIDEIYKAIANGEREYQVKYNCEVEYDLTGLPVLKTTEK